MPGDSPFDQDQVLLREYLEHPQVLDLNAASTIAAGHTHTFEYPSRVRSCTDRTRCTLAVVLSVRSIVNTAETVAFDDTLEALAFGNTNGTDHIAFDKDLIDGDGLTQGFFDGIKIPKFYYLLLGRSIGLLEMPDLGLRGILFLCIIVAQLQGGIAVCLIGFHLGHHTGAHFDDGTSDVAASFIKDAGHTYFLSD